MDLVEAHEQDGVVQVINPIAQARVCRVDGFERQTRQGRLLPHKASLMGSGCGVVSKKAQRVAGVRRKTPHPL
jgi:hypothetical protein